METLCKDSDLYRSIRLCTGGYNVSDYIKRFAAKNKVEEKDAKAKCGFSNRGVQVKISREVYEGDNERKDIQSCGQSKKPKDEHINADSIFLIEPQARFHCKAGRSLCEPSDTAAKLKDLGSSEFQGDPVMTNKLGVASSEEARSPTRKVKEVPWENKASTQSHKSTEDHQKGMTKISTKNEEYHVQRTERSHGKETNQIKPALMVEAPEITLDIGQSKCDESSTLLPERAPDTIKEANLEVKAAEDFVPKTSKGLKEPLRKLNGQQKPKDITTPNLFQKIAKGTKPIPAADARVVNLPKSSENQKKDSEDTKAQTPQRKEESIQNCQNKRGSHCDSTKGSESKESKELERGCKEADEVYEWEKRETGSTETRVNVEKKKELVEKPKDYKIIVDDSPSPPAPFSHRIVTTKQIQVTSSYTIHHHEVLGGGRFGQVHKCAEASTGLELAAKIIKIKGPKEREEVKNEITVMNQLSHANLIQLYDAFEAKNNVTLIMEYVGGGELFDRIIDENYNLTELDTIIFVKQICEGIQYIHQQYVLHLDLKPENILCVNATGNQIKIIDFGLARRYKPREKLRINFGTPEFLAPEVVNYDYVSFSTDMWSVGVIAYMLLSGLSPFLGDHDTETMNNIINANWDFDDEGFENISEEAKEFVSNLLMKEKCIRSTASQCLKHSWLNNLPEKANRYRVRLRSQVMLQKYISQRLWRKNYYAVAAANRFKKIRQQIVHKNA
ncbi:myosin light chain kinase 3 isoform X2 [Narcine bancroftii]|uniref:myosin light chain kinase 3 isoform X2 n=1 Tax=Narcine bancroftii TaxID=1343680 RepID=UPI00383199DE